MIKQLLSAISALALLSSLSSLQSVRAQTVGVSRAASPFSYDTSQEIQIEGRVATILPTPAQGMIPGAHILITGPTGPVDVSLGVFGLRGRDSLSVKADQEVSVTGVMKTVKGKEVLLARTVRAGEKVYTIRNEHGIPVSPQAREHAIQESSQKGQTR